MARFKRRLAGKKARNHGEVFERIVIGHLASFGFSYYKIETGCRIVKIHGKLKPILLKNAVDFVACLNSHTFIFDVKSRSANTISYSEVNKPNSSFKHQVDNLLGFEKNGGNVFFIVGFSGIDEVGVYLPSQFRALKKGESLDIRSSICSGGKYNMIDFQSIYYYFTKDK